MSDTPADPSKFKRIDDPEDIEEELDEEAERRLREKFPDAPADK